MTRQESFPACMAMMRSRDGESFEALMREYRQASNHDLRACLLELLREARVRTLSRCPGACLPAARPYHLHDFSASLSHLFLRPGAPLC